MLQAFRLRLAHVEALPQLAILGVLSGFATGLVAVAFRLGMEWPLGQLLPGGNSEGFEALPAQLRFVLPLAGALVIGAIFHFAGPQAVHVGVGHVIDRYHSHQAHLPARNAILQFIGGTLAVVSGHSVGREGPAVHLGAASSSLLGQYFQLPNNSLRILVGCGVASAIAASFNTPLAGVIFAMEVVLMEYTIAGFIPIILAAVCGAITSRLVFGDTPAFDIPALQMASMLELPYLALCGIVVGLACTAMLLLHGFILRWQNRPVVLRMAIAGLVAGGAGVLVPQVMGIGYDTVELAMLGEASFTLLATIVGAKLITSTLTLALGIPGGSIGPTLVIGACIGGCLGIIGKLFSPADSALIGFYALVCMTAMMAGVLNAPLAALLALLELTYSPGVLLPAMLVIVITCITTRLLSKQPGLFMIGRDSGNAHSPVVQALNRVGVTSAMTRDYQIRERYLDYHIARAALEGRPEWIVIDEDSKTDAKTDQPTYILRAADLAHFLESLEHGDSSDDGTDRQDRDENPIDLLEIPGERWQLHPIHTRATLHEVRELLRHKNGKVAGVYAVISGGVGSLRGIITLERIDRYYQ